MTHAIRNVEAALGDGIKRLSPSETENRAIARKSIVAATQISEGQIFHESNLTTSDRVRVSARCVGTKLLAAWPNVILRLTSKLRYEEKFAWLQVRVPSSV